MPRKLLFESKTCSRCGGCGEYSYCTMYGSVCFKCHGAGVVLTKRGRAAQTWLNAQKTKKGSEIEVGMTILIEGVPGFSASKWATVSAVSGEGKDHKIEAEGKNGGAGATLNGFWNTDVRVAQTKERLAELRVEGLAFQATLTKSGTVKKRKAKAAAAATTEMKEAA